MGVGLLIGGPGGMIPKMKEIYYDKVQVSIFLADNVTDEQRAAIEAKLKQSPEVKSYLYESKEEAYARFKQQFAQQPELVQNTPADALPESFRVELVNPERYEVIAAAFPNGQNGVDQVRDEGDFLDRLFSLLNGARNATLAVAIVQALAALLLISNTIQLAAFNRRNETNIMRLVGASRWYTQLPFILEAALAGSWVACSPSVGWCSPRCCSSTARWPGRSRPGSSPGSTGVRSPRPAASSRSRVWAWPASRRTSPCASTSGCSHLAGSGR
jgi:cell division transport system permease protein